MKVSLNHFFNMQSTNNNKGKQNQTLSQNNSVSRSKNCDEIIISRKIEKTDENNFVDEVKNKISREVTSPCSEEKIQDLKQQIQDGTYKIDIDQIAKKILLS